MDNALARKFSFPKLLLFALPNIVMMVFMSIYSITDGIFVLTFSGENALASLNIFLPFFYVQLSVGIMLGAGSSALIAKKSGEGKNEEARGIFTFITILSFCVGILFLLTGLFFMDGLARLLGANDNLLEDCRTYGFVLLMFAPVMIIQTIYQNLFVTAGKPILGLLSMVAGGIINIVLDYVFMGVLHMGIKGAAIATGLGFCPAFFVAIIYFSVKRKGLLYFVRPSCSLRNLLKILGNGSSEMASNLAYSVSIYLFNYVCLKYYGEAGVSAIAILMYFDFLFGAVFMGYTLGVAPVFSYKYGEGNYSEIKSCFKYSMIFILASSVLMVVICAVTGRYIIGIFTDEGEVYSIAVYGIKYYLWMFAFMGFNIFASGLFTALNNGKISAIIAIARSFVLLAPFIVVLPLIFGNAGVFLANAVSEGLTIIISISMLAVYRKKYRLFGKCE